MKINAPNVCKSQIKSSGIICKKEKKKRKAFAKQVKTLFNYINIFFKRVHGSFSLFNCDNYQIT